MTPPVKPTPPYVHYGRIIVEPEAGFDPASFKTLKGGDYRVVIGCPKGEYDPNATWTDEKGKSQKGKCKVARRVHSVLAPVGRTVTFSSPGRITEDDPSQFVSLYERTPAQIALGEAIRKGRLPPVGEMRSPKLSGARMRELEENIIKPLLKYQFGPEEFLYLDPDVFDEDLENSVRDAGLTSEELDYVKRRVKAVLRSKAMALKRERGMASPNGERLEDMERRWRDLVYNEYGIDVKIENIEGEPWTVVHFSDPATKKWFDIPFDDVAEADEGDETFVKRIAKNFDREWEARVGQYLETPRTRKGDAVFAVGLLALAFSAALAANEVRRHFAGR